MVFVVFPNITETVWRWKLSVACLPGLQVQGWAPAWLWTVKKHLRKKGRKGWGDIAGRNEPLNQTVEARARRWWASGEKRGNSKWELGKRPPLDSPAQEQPWGFFFFKIDLFFLVRGGSSSLYPGFSLVVVRGLLVVVASLVSELGLSSCSAWELSCSVACGILVPQSGTEPMSLSLPGSFLTTGPPGKPQPCGFCTGE